MRVLLRRMERGRDKGDERRGQTDTEAGVLAIRTYIYMATRGEGIPHELSLT